MKSTAPQFINPWLQCDPAFCSFERAHSFFRTSSNQNSSNSIRIKGIIRFTRKERRTEINRSGWQDAFETHNGARLGERGQCD